MKDQIVIQAFSSHAPQKTLTDCIGPARVRYGVRSIWMPLVVATRAKFGPNFLSLSRMRYLGICPYGVASRSCCATQRSVGERVTFTWITFRDAQFDDEESKKRTEEEVSDLQKITGPHPCSMITQEGFPALSTGSFWVKLLYILLDGPFTDPNIQLEELAPNAFCPPESIVGGHLPDQRNCLV